MNNLNYIQQINNELKSLKENNNYRTLNLSDYKDKYIIINNNNKPMLNLSSNDYLGLSSNLDLQKEFLEKINDNSFLFSTTSSRLLTGNSIYHLNLESLLSNLFNSEKALLFNSGYHANIGILPAISDKNTLIIADKLVHASLIDGIKLANCKHTRYYHNNYDHLEKIIKNNYSKYNKIIIVSESIFSMDGDKVNLKYLVQLKRKYNNILLYIDEAHAFGVFGIEGLGCAKDKDLINDIDFLIITFGKAIASIGACLICKNKIYEYLINKARSLIYSTSMSPIQNMWTFFIIKKLKEFQNLRQNLKELSNKFINILLKKGYHCPSKSHIIPIIIGDNILTLKKSQFLQSKDFFTLPIRPPTVPKNTSRIRISLTANISFKELEPLFSYI